MSVLSSLKKDIESVDEELGREALILVDAETKVKVLKEQAGRLKRALAILEGNDSMQEELVQQPAAVPAPLPVPSPPAPIPAVPVAATKPQGPRCGACGGKMDHSYTRVPSGAMVPVMRCVDCNNENY